MIRIAITDDHKLFNEGLSSLLSTFETIMVIEQFADGQTFLDCLPELAIDLVLMDIDMPVLDGIETAKRAQVIRPDLKIIMLSMHNDYQTVKASIQSGVQGFLIKNAEKEELQLAIEQVMNGGEYFTEEIKNKLIRVLQSPNVHQPIKLTPREEDILNCICDGLSSQEISERLFISTNTVETHRKNLFMKTGCNNSVKLLRFAMDNGLIQPKK